MDGVKIGVELRALNNAIKRYMEFSSHHEEIQRATGNNKWIIRYLIVNSHKDVYQKDIESYFNLARSTVSKVLDLMEQKGMIKRLSVCHDGRLKKIVLTEETRQIQEFLREDTEKMEKALIKDFSEEELKNLYNYLVKMRMNVS